MKNSLKIISFSLICILFIGGYLFFQMNSQNNINSVSHGNSNSQNVQVVNSSIQTGAQINNGTIQLTQTPQNVVSTASSSIGSIITDNAGKTLYIFQADTNGQSTCSGICATTWPPLLVASGVIPQGIGVTTKLDVIKRVDGTYQVTANGMPLYYFIADPKAGTLNGQGIISYGAKWYALSPLGQLIISSVPSSNPPIGGGGGGY